MTTSELIPVPKTAAGLPKHPVEVIRYLRQYLCDEIEHTVCTQDGKQWLGKWLDRFLAKSKVDHQPIAQVPIKFTDKPPFVARCGTFLLLVSEIEDFGTNGQHLILRGTILEGLYFNDRGNYSAGDRVSIGPITEYWRRITLPKPRA
jgi:hypothetical protein